MPLPSMVLTDSQLESIFLPWHSGSGGTVNPHNVLGVDQNVWVTYYTVHNNNDGHDYAHISFVSSDPTTGAISVGTSTWFKISGGGGVYPAPPSAPAGGDWAHWSLDANGNITVTTAGLESCVTGTINFFSMSHSWGTPFAPNISPYYATNGLGGNQPTFQLMNANTILLYNVCTTASFGWAAGDIFVGKVNPQTGVVATPVLIEHDPTGVASNGFSALTVTLVSDRYAEARIQTGTSTYDFYTLDTTTSSTITVHAQTTAAARSYPMPTLIVWDNAADQIALGFSGPPTTTLTGFTYDETTNLWTAGSSLTGPPFVPYSNYTGSSGEPVGGYPWRTPKTWFTDPVAPHGGARGYLDYLSYDTDLSGNVIGITYNQYAMEAFGSDGTPNLVSQAHYDAAPLWPVGGGSGGGFENDYDYRLMMWGNDGFGTSLFVFADWVGGVTPLVANLPYYWAGEHTSVGGPKWSVGSVRL